MCYHLKRISPYWSRLWAKAALLTGKQNMLERQYFIHLACSLHHCETVFFWAVYNNTCALYFLRSMVMCGGATQDGCQGQVKLSTAQQRHTDQDNEDQSIHCDEPELAMFWISSLIGPICCSSTKLDFSHSCSLFWFGFYIFFYLTSWTSQEVCYIHLLMYDFQTNIKVVSMSCLTLQSCLTGGWLGKLKGMKKVPIGRLVTISWGQDRRQTGGQSSTHRWPGSGSDQICPPTTSQFISCSKSFQVNNQQIFNKEKATGKLLKNTYENRSKSHVNVLFFRR